MATSTHGLSVRGPFSVGARGWQLRIVVLVYYDAISQESPILDNGICTAVGSRTYYLISRNEPKKVKKFKHTIDRC